MSQDTLSDVLRTVRLRSALFFDLSCGGAWLAEAPGSKDLAALVMPEVDQVIDYHVVTEGECWIAIQGEPPLRLRRGDIVILPFGDPHVVSSAPGMRAEPGVDWYREMKLHNRPFRVAHKDGRPLGPESCGGEPGRDYTVDTSVICGFIGCDRRPFNPLLATLPRLLHLPADDGRSWGAQFAQLAAAESAVQSPGREAMLERLSEMMFVDAVRRHIDRMPEQSTGWLAGLRDRYVGRALALMHEEPAAPWSMDELGHKVGLSRSALHERFVDFIGVPPMQYLTQWRMQLASRLLRESQSTVLSIALRIGYDSEAAFGRAFKRLVGMPPAAWRRQQGQARITE
ncbi:AraC family transcriptional regulator [Arenimonas sp.]|uniref:AraC family transcriptional regulator n=1 Tax=Arenimonas sp. TaxID=1872635 RepID=UPI0039E33978